VPGCQGACGASCHRAECQGASSRRRVAMRASRTAAMRGDGHGLCNTREACYRNGPTPLTIARLHPGSNAWRATFRRTFARRSKPLSSCFARTRTTPARRATKADAACQAVAIGCASRRSGANHLHARLRHAPDMPAHTATEVQDVFRARGDVCLLRPAVRTGRRLEARGAPEFGCGASRVRGRRSHGETFVLC